MVRNKKILILNIVLVISLNIVCASDIQVDYQVFEEKTLVELSFKEVSNLKLKIPYNTEALESNIGYQLENGNLLIESGEDVEIKYITNSLVDKSKNKYFFVSPEPITNSDITLYLPEGAVLSDPKIVSPNNAQISTDGRRLILRWEDFDEKQIVVAYGFVEENNWRYLVIIFLLGAIILISHYLHKRKLRREIKTIKEKARTKKTKETKEKELTKNLYEDEKEIVKYLLTKKDNEAWTKEIVRELGISKVKLSRKLRSLEQKELIKKIPYGSENRIRLLK